MSMTVFQIGLVGAGVIFLIGGAVLAVIAARIAAAGRAAQAEASLRLEASQQLALEVKRLAEKVELSLQSRDAALENAFLRHNDACAASMEATFGARKYPRNVHEHDNDDYPARRHAAASQPHHDYDVDHHDEKRHAAASFKRPAGGENRESLDYADEERKPSLLARLFGRR